MTHAAAVLTLGAWLAMAPLTDGNLPRPPGEVSLAKYQADLEALASETRAPDSAGWRKAQELISDRLSALGYVVERHVYPKAGGTAHGVNILGTLPGRSKNDEILLVSAHYDTVSGQYGADDNASGVAGVLAVAEALAQTGPDRTLMVGFWDLEEYGLVGSTAWAEQARRRGLNILHTYVYEMIGYRDTRPNTQSMPKGLDWLYPAAKKFLEARKNAADSIVMVGTDAALMQAFAHAAAAYDLPVLPLHVWWRLRRLCPPDLRRSDHDAFWRNGFAATMITDSANFRNPNYHKFTDTIDTVDIDFARTVVQTTVAELHRRLNPP